MTNTEIERIGTDILCPLFSAKEPGVPDLACKAAASSATQLHTDSWRRPPLSPETDGRQQQQEISKSRSNVLRTYAITLLKAYQRKLLMEA